MSTITAPNERPIADAASLVDDLAARVKPRADYLVGAEFEFFGLTADGGPLPYAGPVGIEALFGRMQAHGWELLTEGEIAIGMQRGQAALSLEPGGQVELSGSPFARLADVGDELAQVAGELVEAARGLDVRLYTCGLQPYFPREQLPWVPKGRYAVMKGYLGARGDLAHRMMQETGSVQVNLDFSSAADLARKFRVASCLVPIATALFANSSISAGQPSGFQSQRAEIWRHTDPGRCGLLPGAFDEAIDFAGYVDFALGVPLMFLQREGRWLAPDGLTFGEFVARGHAGWHATWGDWNLHLSGIFTDVRVKSYLEIRAADAVPGWLGMAVPALWMGLLYDETALAAAAALTADWRHDEVVAVHDAVARQGLAATWRGAPIREVARQVVGLAHDGLPTGGRRYLDPLIALLDSGESSADRLLAGWRGGWGRDPAGFLAANGIEQLLHTIG